MLSMTPNQTITLAKQRHVEELERLSTCISLVETLGLMIHQLQAERGASCLYLASRGQRFASERAEILEQNLSLAQIFSASVSQHLKNNPLANAKQLTLISWILLGFDQLKSLRYEVTLQKIPFADCIQSFNRLIGSLIALIFEITDNSVDSKLSSYLLALYNLVQAKEFAGQERAVGASIFGSGQMQVAHQQRLLELIALQERHFELFCQFGTQDLCLAWQQLTAMPVCLQHQGYRDTLTKAADRQPLQRTDADRWFDLCSQRLGEIWRIQCALISVMRHTLNALVLEARTDLETTRQYLQQVDQSTQQKEPDSAFFNLSIPVENAYSFLGHDNGQPYPMASIISLLQQQSQQIAGMEHELTETKKALVERKQIERAKGLLMHTLQINEVDAYKWLRSTAMEQNRKIIDVAENVLAKHRQPE